jgi:Zn ribbon nucleic-acid-binding protein
MTPEYRIDAEKRITSYLNRNDVKNIKYMQVEQTFHDLGVEINVWNVKAEGSNWWVVEGEGAPMNLYTQDEFYFSADEAYSFHMGITQRLQARHHKEFKHIIDELPLDIDEVKSISRRLNIAAANLNEIAGAEDIQSIGLTCRESLIELAAVLVEANPGILAENNLKAADFKGIAKAVISIYAPGKRNDNLRKHSRNMAEMAWDYASEIVHSPNRNIPDAKVCLLFTCTIVSIFQNLYLKYLGFDAEEKCPECKSMDIVLHASDDDILTMICKECGHEEIVKKIEKPDDE